MTDKRNHHEWTPEKEAELRRLVESGVRQREISQRFGIPQATISRTLKRLNIESKNSRPWTQKELATLKKLWPAPTVEIAHVIGRPYEAVKQKARLIGLKRQRTEAQKAFLRPFQKVAIPAPTSKPLKTESVEEWLARGNAVKTCPPMYARGSVKVEQ